MCHRVHNLHIWSVRYYPLHSHYIQYLYSTVEDLINIRSLFFELLLYSSVSVDILSYLCEYLSQFPFTDADELKPIAGNHPPTYQKQLAASADQRQRQDPRHRRDHRGAEGAPSLRSSHHGAEGF